MFESKKDEGNDNDLIPEAESNVYSAFRATYSSVKSCVCLNYIEYLLL